MGFSGADMLFWILLTLLFLLLSDEELVASAAAAACRYSIFNKICKFMPHSVVLLLLIPIFSPLLCLFCLWARFLVLVQNLTLFAPYKNMYYIGTRPEK